MIKKDSRTRTVIIFLITLLLVVVCFELSRYRTRAFNKAIHNETFSGATLFGSEAGQGDVSVSAVARSSTWGKIFDFENLGLTENNKGKQFDAQIADIMLRLIEEGKIPLEV